MKQRKFNRALSLKIDAYHIALEAMRTLPPTPVKVRKLMILRSKLRELERRI
jgi:hypothetical protein